MEHAGSNKEWMRMIIENSLVGTSKRNGIVERAIQSVQGMIRKIRSAMAVDRRTNGILVDVVRSRPRWQNGVWATERKISKGKSLVNSPKESRGRGDEQEVRLES